MVSGEPQEQGFDILRALAAIKDVGDFRLREIMSQLGFDPNRSILFYRALVEEAREIMSLIGVFEQNIDTDAKVINQLKTDLDASEQRARTLTVKVRSLQNGTNRKSEALDSEVRQLVADSAKLQAKVLRYDALTQLLIGESKPHTLKVISELYFDMYTDALNAIIYGQSPSDPAVLEKVRQQLRQELKDILRIPQEELEKEMDKLRAENEKLQKNNEILAILYYGTGGRLATD